MSHGSEDILHCTGRMLEAAREGRWEDLSALDAERGRMLAGAGQAIGAADLARMLATNEEIIALAERHREELLHAFSSHRRRRNAAGAYSPSR